MSDPGDRLGPYRLIERIGVGGMGEVWRAAAADGSVVALKTLRGTVAASNDDHEADQAESRARFARECEAARQVDDARVATVLAADPEGAPPWIAAELVEGPTLADLVDEQGPLAPPAVTELAEALAEGLSAIHRADVVHRDLNPTNVVMAAGGPVIVDFGIAWFPGAAAVTDTGIVVGTPAWLAPEQLRDDEPTDASDIWAWGLVVAYAGTGTVPVTGSRPEVVMRRVLDADIDVDLDRLPAALRRLVKEATAASPARRPVAEEILSSLRGPEFPTQRNQVPTDQTTSVRLEAAPTGNEVDEQDLARSAAATADSASEKDNGEPPTPGGRPARWIGRIGLIAVAAAIGSVVSVLAAILIATVMVMVAVGLRIRTEERGESPPSLLSAGAIFVAALVVAGAALSGPLGPVGAVVALVVVLAVFLVLGGDF